MFSDLEFKMNCIIFRLLPESVRWLISKGKHHQAKQTILKAARWNNARVPEHLLQSATYVSYHFINFEKCVRV